MTDPTKTTRRTKVIAALSLLFSLIGISSVLAVPIFRINFVISGLSFLFGPLAWVFAREIKSIILTMLAAFATFALPILFTIAHYTAGP